MVLFCDSLVMKFVELEFLQSVTETLKISNYEATKLFFFTSLVERVTIGGLLSA